MLVNGTSTEGKRIQIGEDFSIIIKKPSVFVDEFSDDTTLVIYRMKKGFENYKGDCYELYY